MHGGCVYVKQGLFVEGLINEHRGKAMNTLKLATLGTVFTAVLLATSLADARGRHSFPALKVIVKNTPGVTIENDSPIPVTIQNGGGDGSAQPYCPCFAAEEIEAELAGSPTECLDDRVLEDGIGSLTRMDSVNALVFVSGRSNASAGYSYACGLSRILGMDTEPVVFFPDIGFTNMMACRSTIINTPSWGGCP